MFEKREKKLVVIMILLCLLLANGMALAGSITGRVTRQSDGEPIANLPVYAEDFDSGEWPEVGITDGNGEYEIAGLASGNYQVKIDTQNTVYVKEYYDNQLNWLDADPVAVIQGQETASIDFELAIGGSITGRVVRESDGEPIADLTVYAEDFDSGERRGQGGRTDGNGEYEIAGLASGNHRVIVDTENTVYVKEYYDDQLSHNHADLVAVILGQVTTGIDFELAISGSISGRVTRESDGEPIANLWVSADDFDSGDFRERGTTDGNGEYEIPGLAPGNYRFYVETRNTVYVKEYYDDQLSRNDADPVAVIQGQETAGIDFELAISGSITGRVTRESDGEPIADLFVRAYDFDLGDSGGMAASNQYMKINKPREVLNRDLGALY